MAERSSLKRLQREYRALCKEPVPQVVARPLPSDILEWHYVLEGSKGTPFAGGCYYGKLKFPQEFPYKPPSISMTTPNGRFAVNKKICLSMSDFHPETWNPMWSVASILTGLLSFMMEDGQTAGSIKTSDEEKRTLARASLAYNCVSKNCPNFKKLFPEYVEKYHQQLIAADQPALQKILQRNVVAQPSSGTTEKIGDDEAGLAGVLAQRKQKKKQLPSWLLLFLVSLLGIVMALPLLQL